MERAIGLIVAFLLCGLPAFAADTPPLLAQQPALSATQIVFVCAGDLWGVPRQGGEARRLPTGVGVEAAPSFSPRRAGRVIARGHGVDRKLSARHTPEGG